MNKRQKEVLQAQLDAEKKTLRELKQVYSQALKDCESKIRELSARTDMENLQSIIYQKQYQEALKAQLEGVLAALQSNSYATISEYLTQCYQNGYIGAMYDIHGQGIPIIMPIDQQAVTRAIQTDSKISKGLYNRLGEDVGKLKTSIRAELSRGIANGSSWNEVAGKLSKSFKNTPFSTAFSRAMLITRTEGHRVQVQSAMDAQQAAKDAGADVLKQWDAALDDRTRETHRILDGQIRELNAPFEVGGKKADAPGMFGDPAEDCNCRCALLQRARWALDEDELKTLQNRAGYFGLDKSQDFKDFKSKYLQLPKNADTIDTDNDNWQGINFSQNYQSKKEAVKALADKYGIAFSDSRKYPMDAEMLCDTVSWIDSFSKEYPIFVENNPAKVPKIVCKAPSAMKNCVGYFQYYRYSRAPVELALNGEFHSDKKKFEEYEKSCIASKWTVANATTRKTFVHEYGHYVSNSVCAVRGDKWEHNFIQECVDEYRKMHPEYTRKTYIGLQQDCDEVSQYGMTSESECFAETFAEYFGGENPRDFAKIFGKKLDTWLKNAEMSADGQRLLIPNPK